MSFLGINDLAHADSFRTRVMVGMVRVAGAVLAEPQGTLSDTAYAKRTQYAAQVLRSPSSLVDTFVWPVLADETIATQGLDADDTAIEAQISKMWDSLSAIAPSNAASTVVYPAETPYNGVPVTSTVDQPTPQTPAQPATETPATPA